MKRFYQQITFIQKRMRDKCICREQKVEVLFNYWDKMYGQMQMKASATKDAEANKLLTQLVLVPREVKWEVCRKFVDKCSVLHAVAFF
jgi:hypothetical protein